MDENRMSEMNSFFMALIPIQEFNMVLLARVTLE
jgi:hypothetical protein